MTGLESLPFLDEIDTAEIDLLLVSQYVLQPEGLSYFSQAMCMVLAGIQYHVRFTCLHNLKMTYSAKARVSLNPIL